MPWGMDLQPESELNRRDILDILATHVDTSLEEAIKTCFAEPESPPSSNTFSLSAFDKPFKDMVYSIGVHNTLLARPLIASSCDGNDRGSIKPSLGGCRIKVYNSLDASLADVSALGPGMTYKWATLNNMFMRMFARGEAFPAEVNASRIGGGKSVLYIPEMTHDELAKFFPANAPLSELQKNLLDKLAAAVGEQKGRYIFAPDMSTNILMMDYVKQKTSFVSCLSEENGGSGDPSVITAEGVFYGMKAAVLHRTKKHTLKNLVIGIEGLGKVGYVLLQRIIEEYPDVTRIVLTDKDQHAVERVKELFAQHKSKTGRSITHVFVDPNDFLNQDMHVYSPNARGQVLTPENVEKLAAKSVNIIAGGANNQYALEDPEAVDQLLFRYRITQAPDYVINCGGILNVVYELPEVIAATGDSYHRPRALFAIRGIHDVLSSIFDESGKRALPTRVVADTLVHEHLARVIAHPKCGAYTPQTIRNKEYMQ